jgi:hypothetical protein
VKGSREPRNGKRYGTEWKEESKRSSQKWTWTRKHATKPSNETEMYLFLLGVVLACKPAVISARLAALAGDLSDFLPGTVGEVAWVGVFAWSHLAGVALVDWDEIGSLA